MVDTLQLYSIDGPQCNALLPHPRHLFARPISRVWRPISPRSGRAAHAVVVPLPRLAASPALASCRRRTEILPVFRTHLRLTIKPRGGGVAVAGWGARAETLGKAVRSRPSTPPCLPCRPLLSKTLSPRGAVVLQLDGALRTS